MCPANAQTENSGIAGSIALTPDKRSHSIQHSLEMPLLTNN